jgi:hypothetical protein
MGLFNFRTFAIMALCFAVFAFAAPATTIETRLDLSLNTAPITNALTQVSNGLTGALTAVDGVQKGAIGAVSVSSKPCDRYFGCKHKKLIDLTRPLLPIYLLSETLLAH